METTGNHTQTPREGTTSSTPDVAQLSDAEAKNRRPNQSAGTETGSDATLVMGTTIQDLDERLALGHIIATLGYQAMQQDPRSYEQQLAALRCWDLERECLTRAGVILFGQQPRHFIPGNYVQFLRLPGTELTDVPMDQAEISGDLGLMIRTTIEKVVARIETRMVKVDILRESLHPSYPEAAVREILVNAFLHRDYHSHTPMRVYLYSDRLEISSPGGLHGGVTPESMQTQNSYRNPIIAEALKTMGVINRFGYGIQRAESAMRHNGSPPLEWRISPTSVTAILRSAH